MLIRFECPRCKEPMKADWERPSSGDVSLPEIDCPVCKLKFEPAGWLEVPPPAPPQPVVAPPSREKILQEEREWIRMQAGIFTLVAILFAFIGGMTLFATVASGDRSYPAIITGGSLLGAAIWFYLIAQIVHIRANTHK